MRVALGGFARLAPLALFALAGCVRNAEGIVREQAASAFRCADYALHVEEVGPDVYRAAGCGQELIYACKAAAPQPGRVADVDDDAVMECARRPN
jgi:hypothetical protein